MEQIWKLKKDTARAPALSKCEFDRFFDDRKTKLKPPNNHASYSRSFALDGFDDRSKTENTEQPYAISFVWVDQSFTYQHIYITI